MELKTMGEILIFVNRSKTYFEFFSLCHFWTYLCPLCFKLHHLVILWTHRGFPSSFPQPKICMKYFCGETNLKMKLVSKRRCGWRDALNVSVIQCQSAYCIQLVRRVRFKSWLPCARITNHDLSKDVRQRRLEQYRTENSCLFHDDIDR
ncbi:unnamed protein product [Nesidiocoris tenuis]|uniref:Uncharacterized protein n=1 Tax=Nesidiocoris tenuis TaxID=355587 RepID=A0A6H5H657_9HEMI|nr:unnamed protein product [Nesidiocoris tenuis]